MKIILRVYNEMRLGNLSTMSIEIPNNKITVKELKNKIYYKYKIKPSEQRLTYRICHKKLITLTDIYPLNYFFIKEYSMIFIEIISNEEKNEKIDNVAHKKYNSIKIKYMNMLGYYMPDAKTFQKNQNSNSNAFVKKNSYSSKELRLFTFPSSNYTNSAINSDDDYDNLYLVSDNKYKKELYKKSIKSNNINEENFRENDINNAKIIKDLFSLDIVEKLSIIIRQNDFKKLKSLLFQYNTYLNKDKDISYYNNNLEKDKKKYAISQVNTNYKTSFNTEYTSNSLLINNNICEALDKNGWNSIHYSSYFGYYEILDYIINKFNTKSNINIINNEGWNALSLAVYKQQIQCVELLMTYDGIDVNYNGPMGTALHIACKKNNRQIVSLLLYKADITFTSLSIPKTFEPHRGIAASETTHQLDERGRAGIGKQRLMQADDRDGTTGAQDVVAACAGNPPFVEGMHREDGLEDARCAHGVAEIALQGRDGHLVEIGAVDGRRGVVGHRNAVDCLRLHVIII